MVTKKTGTKKTATKKTAIKKTTTSNATVPEPEEVVPALDSVPEEPPLVEVLGDVVKIFGKPALTVGAWHGIPCYRCMWCAFDSLKPEVASKHVLDRHMAKLRG